MLKHYRLWASTNPLWVWFLSVAVCLGIASLFSLIPGRRHTGFDFVLVGVVLAPPTVSLIQRFSLEERQARPVPSVQEKGLGLLAAFALLCSLTAFSVAKAGRHLDWPTEVTGSMLMVFSISTLLSLALAYAVRYTKLGQWVLRLVLGWLALIVLAAAAGMVRHLFVA